MAKPGQISEFEPPRTQLPELFLRFDIQRPKPLFPIVYFVCIHRDFISNVSSALERIQQFAIQLRDV